MYDIVCVYVISCVYRIVTYVRDPDQIRGSHFLSFLHYFGCTCVLLVVCLLHFVFCSDSQSGWCLFSWSLPDSAIWGLERSVSSPYIYTDDSLMM